MSDIFRDYSFGGWLRHLRVEKKITLREAARRLKVDVGNLSKMERSELDPPSSAEKINKICKALKIEKSASLLKSVAYQHHIGKLKEKFWEIEG